MGENTAIQWTDHTFNPWVGCSKVSPACDRCYAETWAKRSGHPELWAGERRRTSAANWRQPLKWSREAEAAGIRKRVFCASLADVFDNQVPAEWRADLWALIAATPWLDWQLLTKRPQNIAKMLPIDWVVGWRNVWLGTTVENREEAARRMPLLRAVRAEVHFLSIEPLLEDLGDIDLTGIDWAIIGGESGGGARPFRLAWARSLIARCRSAGTRPFLKQLGVNNDAYVEARAVTGKAGDMAEWPEDLRVREMPPLDGRGAGR